MQRPRKVARKRTAQSDDTFNNMHSTHRGTESDAFASYDATEFADNMAIASKLWQQILQKSSIGMLKNSSVGIGHTDPFNIGESFMRVAGKVAANPYQWMESQMGLWKGHMDLWQQTTQHLLGKAVANPQEVQDRRFRDEAWQNNAYFDYLKRSYLLNGRWLKETVKQVPGLDRHTAQKVEFFTNQLIDALAPSNFLLTNPEVMRTTLESNGENIVKGLHNMLEDIERGGGKLRISMTDDNAFTLGENIASTPGQVVYENDLMQLIQYEPMTKQVYARPILIMPAWINKYYVLDLRPENSLVRWLLGRGYTVFMISWVNPDETLAQKRFDDYLAEGPLDALDVIESITGTDSTNLIGYCLGGTLASITLAYLRAHDESERISSVTYLTTMVDFADAGELGVFIDDNQLENLEGRMDGKGYLEASEMANTFNMLRANDLIWSFVVNNYLLGKEPFAFDMLYWNSDATRMPSTAHSFYLRNMYQHNMLVKPGGIELLDTPINLSRITTPSYILSTKDDHIAPWQSTYVATQIYDGPITFVLAQSGHIAGVINPPAKKKYGYWSNDKLPPRAADWLTNARFFESDSWWENWEKWQRHYAGSKVKAPKIGNAKFPTLEAAPGAYARVKA